MATTEAPCQRDAKWYRSRAGQICPKAYHVISLYRYYIDIAEAIEGLEKERDKLRNAVRTLRDAKGDYANQDAYENLVALLPESQ